MFSRLSDDEPAITFTLDGQIIEARKGESLAAALLTAGVQQLRLSSLSGQPRAPFCMMGSCFECLVEIDGVTVQACMTEAIDGMALSRTRNMREPNDG